MFGKLIGFYCFIYLGSALYSTWPEEGTSSELKRVARILLIKSIFTVLLVSWTFLVSGAHSLLFVLLGILLAVIQVHCPL